METNVMFLVYAKTKNLNQLWVLKVWQSDPRILLWLTGHSPPLTWGQGCFQSTQPWVVASSLGLQARCTDMRAGASPPAPKALWPRVDLQHLCPSLYKTQGPRSPLAPLLLQSIQSNGLAAGVGWPQPCAAAGDSSRVWKMLMLKLVF